MHLFFIVHLRRYNFPMDRAMSEGSVYPDTARHERPAWIGRLKGSGKLESALVAEAGARPKTVYYLLGHTAIVIGAFLLIGALANAGRIVY